MSRFFSILFLTFISTWGLLRLPLQKPSNGNAPLVNFPESQGNFSVDVDSLLEIIFWRGSRIREELKADLLVLKEKNWPYPII